MARGLPAQRGRKAIIDDFLRPIRTAAADQRGDPLPQVGRAAAASGHFTT